MNKSAIFQFNIVVIITILAVALISSSTFSSDAFAAKKSPRDICKGKLFCKCFNDADLLKASCCSNNGETKEGKVIDPKCEECSINTNTGDFF